MTFHFFIHSSPGGGYLCVALRFSMMDSKNKRITMSLLCSEWTQSRKYAFIKIKRDAQNISHTRAPSTLIGTRDRTGTMHGFLLLCILRHFPAHHECKVWLFMLVQTSRQLRPVWLFSCELSGCFLFLNSKDCWGWKSQEISSSWNTRTSPSGTRNHATAKATEIRLTCRHSDV